MGLDLKAFKFILGEMADGLDLRRTVTLGRQSVVVCPPKQLHRALRHAGINAEIPRVDALVAPGYADLLLKYLGDTQLAARGEAGDTQVDSIDKSDFEGASIRHDMNEPVPDALRGRFTAVIDGGTLEHVFNVPVAFRNCMEMLDRGGRFISFTISNGASGHGFYQFSPELFFRVFSGANGFEVRRLLLQEAGGRWYEVLDPAETGRRAEFPSALYTSLFVSAERCELRLLLREMPQQSDYSAKWASGGAAGPLSRGKGLVPFLYNGGLGHWLRTTLKFVLTYFRPDGRSFRRTVLYCRRTR